MKKLLTFALLFVSALALGQQAPRSAFATKNHIINGGFDIWQRGTSISVPTGAVTYLADRWRTQFDGSGTVTASRQTFTPGTLPGEPIYYFQYAQTVAGSGQTYIDYAQNRIEGVRTLAGKKATLSFYASADTSRTVTLQGFQSFGSGGSTTVSIALGNVNLTTSWQRFVVPFTVPSVTGKTIGADNFFSINFAGTTFNTTQTINLAQVMLNEGPTADGFQLAGGNIQGELALAQRYSWRQVGQGPLGIGIAAVATACVNAYVSFPVPMRTVPVLVLNASASNYGTLRVEDNGVNGCAAVTASSFTQGFSNRGALLDCTGMAGFLTANRQCLIYSNVNGNIGYDAEL